MVNSKDKGIFISIVVGLVAAFSIISYGLFLIFITWPIDKFSISNAGVFGDSFGVLTSLFSALAFAGVIYTNAIQREEFKLQRIELENQRSEMAMSKYEMYKQGFENTFFQMNRLLSEKVYFVSCSHPSLNIHRTNQIDTIKGVQALRFLKETMTPRFKQLTLLESTDQNEKLTALQEIFSVYNEDLGNSLDPYLRVLRNILSLIEKSEIINKDFYSDLIHAQLSNQEIFFIFYNSLLEKNNELKKILIDLKIMENIDRKVLYEEEHIHLVHI